jgi:dienelactone hydrolase
MRFPLHVCLVTFAALASGPSATAELRTRVVEYEHEGVVLEGFLAFDDAQASEQKKQPGVLVCPEWWGNNDYPRARAKKLAELGYVAFAIDVYGKGKVTSDPKQAAAWAGELSAKPELGRGRAKAGLAQLVRQPEVDASRLAVIGYCMGGTVALELARTGADLDCVVAFHASKLSALGDAADNAKIKASLTICHGLADTFVSAEDLAGFHAQMKAAKVTYQFLAYSGAVHAFTNPDADKAGLPGVAYDQLADRRSWEHMKLALAEAFAGR